MIDVHGALPSCCYAYFPLLLQGSKAKPGQTKAATRSDSLPWSGKLSQVVLLPSSDPQGAWAAFWGLSSPVSLKRSAHCLRKCCRRLWGDSFLLSQYHQPLGYPCLSSFWVRGSSKNGKTFGVSEACCRMLFFLPALVFDAKSPVSLSRFRPPVGRVSPVLSKVCGQEENFAACLVFNPKCHTTGLRSGWISVSSWFLFLLTPGFPSKFATLLKLRNPKVLVSYLLPVCPSVS